MKKIGTGLLGVAALLLLVGCCLLLLGIPLSSGFALMFEGSAKDKFAISSTLVRATPLLLAGTGVCIAWRAGAFNIGGEGQLLFGALASAALGKLILTSGLGAFGSFLMLIVSALAGGGWSALACWISEKRGVDLVIATILMNFIADKVLFFFVDGPLRKLGQTTPLTDQLPDALMLWRPSRQMDLNIGTFLAILLAVAAGYWLFRTQSGYLTRVVGENARFARANRINAASIRFKAMSLSGAFCGLAGGVQYLGINGQLTSSFSQQYGFLAIPVALVAGLNPIIAIFSSIFFGGLFAATSNLSRFGNIGNSFVYIIQAGAVLGLLAFREIRKHRSLLEVST